MHAAASASISSISTKGRASPQIISRLRNSVWRRIGPFEKLVYDFKNHHPRPDALGPSADAGADRLDDHFCRVADVAAAQRYRVAVRRAWLADVRSVVLIIGGTFAQYFHGTLHREDNPAIVRWMRAAGLLMTPKAHQLHHDTLARDFATNNGWSNPLINRVFAIAIRRRWLTEAGSSRK